MSRSPLLTTLVVCCAVLLGAGHPAQAAKPPGTGGGSGGGGGGTTPSFLVVPLANEAGSVHGMNDAVNGVVELVGRRGDAADQAVYWRVTDDTTSANVVTRVLPALTPGADLTARDINNEGVIVGHETQDQGRIATPLAWTSATAGAPVVLRVPDLYEPNYVDEQGVEVIDESAQVGQISDDRLIVGFVRRRVAPPILEPDYLIVWKYDVVEGQVVVLDALVVETGGEANWYPAVSSTGGHVVFSDRLPDGGGARALRTQVAWDAQNGLSVVPGSSSQLFASDAYCTDVNNAGTAAGTWDNVTGTLNYGFAMDIDGDLLNIPTLPGFRIAGTRYTYRAWRVNSVNDSHEVVTSQWAHSSDGNLARPRDAVSVLGGTATDLSTYDPNWVPGSAHNINNNGWIAGNVQSDSGQVPVLIIR